MSKTYIAVGDLVKETTLKTYYEYCPYCNEKRLVTVSVRVAMYTDCNGIFRLFYKVKTFKEGKCRHTSVSVEHSEDI